MASENLKEILPDFQEFLKSNKLAQEKNIPFHALWVSRFLSFVNKDDIGNIDELVLKFLEGQKKTRKLEDWQIQQAEQALKLYLDHFNARTVLQEATGAENSEDNQNEPAVMEKMRSIIRLKHYSYSTERTYLDWVKRFFIYVSETHKSISYISEKDLKNFLTWLAVNQRVSSSTQNQAFNALLFLFREVLRKDVGDLKGTVRAKRGVRLPVVLTIGEVNGLRSNYRFGMVTGNNYTDVCGMKIDKESRTVEPREQLRGFIARTYKYMDQAYPGHGIIGKSSQKLFDAWDKQCPVDKWECEHCRRIEKIQGNENRIVKEQCKQAGIWPN